MLVSLDDDACPALFEADVCVIGAGAAGITIALPATRPPTTPIPAIIHHRRFTPVARVRSPVNDHQRGWLLDST